MTTEVGRGGRGGGGQREKSTYMASPGKLFQSIASMLMGGAGGMGIVAA